MNIGIIGSKGRMGQTLCEILSKGSNTIIEVDLHNISIVDQVAKKVDLFILAVPFLSAVEYIQKFSENVTCIEVTSIKTPMIPFRGRIISIHPLFGPRSFLDVELRNIVFIKDISFSGSVDLVKQLFPGFNIIETTASEHDALVAKVQVAPYLISILANLINCDTELKTRSKKVLEKMAGVSNDQNPNVLLDTISRNPFSMYIIKEIQEKINEMVSELSDSNSDFRIEHKWDSRKCA